VKVWPSTISFGVHWMSSVGESSPVSSAASAVTGLNVDPGG
jgi:hypothetical protein